MNGAGPLARTVPRFVTLVLTGFLYVISVYTH